MSESNEPASSVAAISLLAIVFTLVYLNVRSYAENSPPGDTPDASPPPLVPHRLPWLGHVFKFLNPPTRFLQKCRARYGSIYKLLLAGNHMVVISDPIAIVCLQTKSPKVVGYLDYQKFGPITGITDNVRVPYVFDVLHGHVYTLASHAMANRNLAPLVIPANKELFRCLADLTKGDSLVDVELHEFVGTSIYAATVMTFFGPHFSPDTYRDLAILDRDMYWIASGIPNPFAGYEGKQARERLVSYIDKYLQAAWSEDNNLEGAPEFMSGVIREFNKSGLSNHEKTSALFSILWGMNGNIIQVTFWAMAYLMADATVFKRVSADVRSAVSETITDVESLLSADPTVLDEPRFRVLDSIFQETLRLSLLPTSIRQALSDTVVTGSGGKSFSILKGEHLLMDVRGMHFDPALFSEPEKFKYNRFLDIDGYPEWEGVKTLVPWGGGLSMCKGRNYARHIVKIFLVLCLDMFDIELPPEGSPVPKVASKGSGLTVVLTDEKPRIRLRRRSKF